MSTSDLVIWLSTGVLLAAVGLVAFVARLEQALPRRSFDLDRFLAEAQASSLKDTRR